MLNRQLPRNWRYVPTDGVDPVIVGLRTARIAQNQSMLDVSREMGNRTESDLGEVERGQHDVSLSRLRMWTRILGYDLALVPIPDVTKPIGAAGKLAPERRAPEPTADPITLHLRRIRRSCNLSLAELAALAGFHGSSSWIGRCEIGIKDIRLSTTRRLAYALGHDIILVPGTSLMAKRKRARELVDRTRAPENENSTEGGEQWPDAKSSLSKYGI